MANNDATLRGIEVRTLLSALPVAALVCDETDRLVGLNDPARLLLGFEDACSLPLFSDVVADGRRQLMKARAALASRDRYRLRTLQLVRDPSRYVDVYASHLQLDASVLLLLTLIDVTHVVRADEKSAQENSLLSQLFTNSPNAIVELDLNGYIKDANAAFVQLFGYATDELLNRPLDELIVPSEQREEGNALSVEVLRHGMVSTEAIRQHRDGTRITCTVSGYSVRSGNEQTGMYAVYRDIHHLAEERDTFKRVAHEDALTGIHNRRGFEVHCRTILEESGRTSSTLVFIDLDNFKPINDCCGHAAGDKALQDVAGILQSSVRATDVIGRLGGDEFAILLPHCDNSSAHAKANRIVLLVQELRDRMLRDCTNRCSAGLGASIGIKEGKDDLDFENWLAAADRACYDAKESGKNRVCIAA